jgi:hypothetical protein
MRTSDTWERQHRWGRKGESFEDVRATLSTSPLCHQEFWNFRCVQFGASWQSWFYHCYHDACLAMVYLLSYLSQNNTRHWAPQVIYIGF